MFRTYLGLAGSRFCLRCRFLGFGLFFLWFGLGFGFLRFGLVSGLAF